MYLFETIAENKILAAQREGQFDHLAGQGKPLSLDDDRQVPAELRMACRILKNAGCLPPELELRQQINRLEDLLRFTEDEYELLEGRRKLAVMETRLSTMRGQTVNFWAEHHYGRSICRQISASNRNVPNLGD